MSSTEEVSPDGSIRIVYAYSGGDRTPVITEPRVIDAETGEVLIDLWGSSFNGRVQIHEDRRLTLTIDDPYLASTVFGVNVDLKAKTFLFEPGSAFGLGIRSVDGPGSDTPEPLALFKDRFAEARRIARPPQPPKQPRPRPGILRQLISVAGYLGGAGIGLVMATSKSEGWMVVISGWFCVAVFGVFTVVGIGLMLKRGQ
ncbi:MAG TPA: hypothetical protein VJX67_10405 [Blastocatellia bacterium]|nr:hypothetical protein [Blastocatellia bacterium]